MYFAGYVALAGGLVQLAGRAGRPDDRAAWVAALIVAGAATVVAWTLVFDPYLADPTMSPLELVVSSAYPFADLLLVAVITLKGSTTRIRPPGDTRGSNRRARPSVRPAG
jgi:hypothetical protein